MQYRPMFSIRSHGSENRPFFPTVLANPFFGINEIAPPLCGTISLMPHTALRFFKTEREKGKHSAQD